MGNLNFYQITDLHFYAAEKIGAGGKYFAQKCATDQKCVAESEAIIDATFKKLCEDKENEIVIISGDLTYDGEKESHDALKEKLYALKKNGKRVFVTFATHDFHMNARKYDDEGIHPLEKYTREELREHYADFGWNEKLSEHVPSYSYSVRPFEGFRFLMLNDDGDAEGFCGYYESCLNWIREQVKEADEAGERIIAVTHHPALPPTKLYPIYSHRNMLGGYETAVPMLADLGVEYIFTGHTHMQSIKRLVTEKGNKLYHINTGSVTAYPAPIRKVNILENGLDVKTEHIDSFDWELGGLSVEDYMKDHFTFLLRDIFDSMENDIEHFKTISGSFSLEPETVEKIKPLVRGLGRVINNLTFKSLGRAMLVKIDSVAARVKVRDFILALLCQMFSGERKYTPETVEYQAFTAIMNRLSFIKIKDSMGNPVTLKEIMTDLMDNEGEFDNQDAFLPY